MLLQNALNGESKCGAQRRISNLPLINCTDVMCPRDGFVVIKNSEHLSGNLCKTTLGLKKGLVFALARDVNEATAAIFGNDDKIFTRWLILDFPSVSMTSPSEDLKQFKKSHSGTIREMHGEY